MLLFIPLLQMSLRVGPDGRFRLAFFHGVAQRQVMMLADKGEDHGGHICFEREPRDQPLVQWSIFWEEHVKRDFNPGGL